MDMKYKKIQKDKCMIKKINKNESINILRDKTHQSSDDCIMVNSILSICK